MYIKGEISLPKAEEVVVSDITQNELEFIKKKTKTQLELLRKQTERLKLFDPNIDIDFVIKWYEIKSSQFSKLAYFYGRKGWFDRQVLHGQVLAGAIVLGFAVHALAFFVVVAAYYKLSEMLSEHYKIEENNKEEIKKSFNKLSEGLRQSIESFNEMERKLDEIFTTLEEQNETLSITIAQLGLEAGKLHAQVVILEGMLKQLQEQQKKILVTTDKISDVGEKLGKEIESLSSVILERKVALDCISKTIVSVAKESVLVKNEVAQTSVGVKEEGIVIKEQIKKCDLLKEKLQRTDELIELSGIDKQLEDSRKSRASYTNSQERAKRLLSSFKNRRNDAEETEILYPATIIGG